MGLNPYETRDINFKGVVLFGAALLVAAVIVHFVVVGLFRQLATRRPPVPPTPPAATRAGLTISQAQDMKTLRAAEHAVLTNYGWIDRDRGIVRIPIERAMELVVAPP